MIRSRAIILCLLIVSLILSSCKKREKEFPSPYFPTEKEVENMQYLHLSTRLSLAGISLRGLSQDEIIANIQKKVVKDLKSIDLLFFTTKSGQESYQFSEHKSYAVSEVDGKLKSSIIKTFTESPEGLTIEFTPIKMEKRDYKLLVLFNINEDLSARLTKDLSLATFDKAIFLDSDVNSQHYNTDNMFIARTGAVHLSERNFSANKSGLPTETLSVEMISSKAYYTVIFSGALSTTGDQVSPNFQVFPDVVNKKFSFYAESINPSVIEDYKTDISWASPTYTPTYLSNGGIKAQRENFTYVTDLDVFKSYEPDEFTTGNTEAKYGQISENTHMGPRMSGYYVTRLIFRFQYAPQGIVLGNGWARFNGVTMSKDEFKALIDKVSNSTDDRTLTLYEKEFKAAYTEAKNVGQSKFYYKDLVKSGLRLENSFSYAGIDYYHDGYCYYSIPILHKMVESFKGSGELRPLYGVVRNTIYKIQINKIAAAGVTNIYGLNRNIDYNKMGYANSGIKTSYPEVVEVDVDL